MKQVRVDDGLYADAAVVPSSLQSDLGFYDMYGKRALDVVVALLLIPIVGATVLLLALVVFAQDGGRPLFGHKRVGRDGRLFHCWKIRSMVPDAEERLVEYLERDLTAAAEWEELRKLTNDPRITPLGRFLRRSSLDELPQLWNVLRGEMSFVGPRPVVLAELPKYGPARGAYCAMKPGITGLWQISGRNDVTYSERVTLDLEYLRRVSLGLDLGIILRTAAVVMRPTGR